MPYPLIGMAGAGILARASTWFATSRGGQFTSSVFHNPFVQSGQFGLGYTSSAYVGYGATNTWDPFSLHEKHYKQPKPIKFRMPYGRYGRRYNRYRRYRGYRRRSYYRRRYYY